MSTSRSRSRARLGVEVVRAASTSSCGSEPLLAWLWCAELACVWAFVGLIVKGSSAGGKLIISI